MVYFICLCKALCFVFTNWDVIVFGCRGFCGWLFVFNFWKNFKVEIHKYFMYVAKIGLIEGVLSEQYKNKMKQTNLNHHFRVSKA